MHPLFDNMQSLSYEELEKRHVEINRRMQMYVRNQMNNPQIWDQLSQMNEALYLEKQERALKLNASLKETTNPIVVNTDPLEDDEPIQNQKPNNTKFNPIT